MNSIKQLRRIYTIPSSLLLDGRRQGPRRPPPVAPLLRGKCELASLILRLLYRTFIIFPKMESAQKRGHKRRRTPPFRVGPGRAGGLRLAVPPSLLRPSGVRSVFTIRPRGTPKDDIISLLRPSGGRGRTRIQIRQEKGERGKRGNHGGDGRLSGLPALPPLSPARRPPSLLENAHLSAGLTCRTGNYLAYLLSCRLPLGCGTVDLC